jgi:hypothetical protein
MAMRLRMGMALSAAAIFLCKLTHPEAQASFSADDSFLDALVDELSSRWASNPVYPFPDQLLWVSLGGYCHGQTHVTPRHKFLQINNDACLSALQAVCISRSRLHIEYRCC